MGTPPPPPSPSPPPPGGSGPSSSWWTVTAGASWCLLVADAAGNSGACVTDGPSTYGNNERCTIVAERDLYVSATEFATESCCDYLAVGSLNSRYQGADGPYSVHMAAGTTMYWHSDNSITGQGFTVCAAAAAGAAPPPPSPPPSPPPWVSSTWWVITSGSQYCSLSSDGTCVTDGPGSSTGMYGNNERCTIQAAAELYVTATTFQTESGVDVISIYGTQHYAQFSGSLSNVLLASPPLRNVQMSVGSTMTWSSSSSTRRTGWTLCATPDASGPCLSGVACAPSHPPPAPSPPPPGVVASYSLRMWGTCPYAAVSSVNECRAAAVALDFVYYGDQANSFGPHGCFAYFDDDASSNYRMYFNGGKRPTPPHSLSLLVLAHADGCVPFCPSSRGRHVQW